MTQEVAMFGLKTQSSEERKKKAQQERLVNRDFPWLWAVRNHWLFSAVEITVCYTDKWLEHMLKRLCSEWGETEVWLYYQEWDDKGDRFVVKKAEFDPNLTCVEVISRTIRGSLLYIVTVYPYLIQGVEKDVTVTIFRPPRGAWRFNEFVKSINEECIALAREYRRAKSCLVPR